MKFDKKKKCLIATCCALVALSGYWGDTAITNDKTNIVQQEVIKEDKNRTDADIKADKQDKVVCILI